MASDREHCIEVSRSRGFSNGWFAAIAIAAPLPSSPFAPVLCMSNEQSQGQARERKREAVQRPLRQGWHWVERQFDVFRERSAPHHSTTRPANPQATGGSPSDTIPSYRSAHRSREIPVPPSQRLNPLRPPAQETLHSSSIEPLESVPSVRTGTSAGQARDRLPESVSPFPPPQPFSHESFDNERLLAVNYGPTYNIETAGNVFSGVNYGSVTMISNDDFIVSYLYRLKVSVKADHKYYAEDEEAALRRYYCTPGTRIDVLEGVMSWATNMSPSSEIVYWLSGHAGAGKTTIAYTIACRLETLVNVGNTKVMLGGSFFCSRQFLDTQSVSSIIRTIVYRLALRSKTFQNALKTYGRLETVDQGPRAQLMGLLVEPWLQCLPERREKNEPCYVIPIDALDELKGAGGTEFLSTLFDVVDKQDLSGLKFFVTSRSEPTLVKQITSFPNKQVCRLEEVPLAESSADIKLYLNENLAECADGRQIQKLVADAAGLFIYAATVVEYLKGRSVEEQRSLLEGVLSDASSTARQSCHTATATLDNLYLQILETSLVDPRDRNNPRVSQACLLILHTFLSTFERISIAVAVGILNATSNQSNIVFNNGIAEGVLHRLHAVLYSQGGKIMWFHKSFTDFLFDESRSQRFFCDTEQFHYRLADGCFGIMSKQLRFNIADIPSSHQLDCENPSLSNHINTNISAALRYACGHWSAHVVLASDKAPDSLAETLHKFLQLQVLFWIEAMILLGQRGRCERMLRDCQQRFLNSKGSAELVSQLADAAAFAAYHSTSKAALSTPHFYVSSLATFPRHSATVQTWRRQFSAIPGFIDIQEAVRGAVVASINVGFEVNTLAVSPDGIHVAVGSPDGLVRIWDLSTGEEAMVLKGHTDCVSAVAYSPDSTHVISGSKDSSIRLWDLSTGEGVKVLEERIDSVNALAYSPDGIHVVSGSDNSSVRVWDLSTGEETRVLQGHSDWVRAVAYSPDGSRVVSGSDDSSVRVWDVATGEEVKVLKGHTNWVTAVAYSPDGTHIVSGSGDKSVRVWDLSTGEEVRAFKRHTDWVNAVAYSPDGVHVISSSDDNSIRVWELSTGEELRVLKGHADCVSAVAYPPDGAHVVSGSKDSSIRVWDLSTGEEVKVRQGHTDWVRAVAYSPDGAHAISGSDDKSIRVWDLSTGEELRVLEGHTDCVSAVAYSPDGTHIVSGSRDSSIRVWNLSTGEVRVLEGHTDWVHGVAYSPDGTHVVSSSRDSRIRVWDLSTGEGVKILKGHTDWVRVVAYSPDGTHLVSGSDDKSIRVWDLSTGKEVRVLKGHTDCVSAVAYSPDGAHVVSGSKDSCIRVWDISAGEVVKILKGHTEWVRALAYSPNGTHVVSGSDDKSVWVWDLSTGEGVMVLKGHTNCVNAVAYSPDGTLVVSGSDDSSVRVWGVSPGHSLRYIRETGSQGEYTGWLLSPTNSSARLMYIQPEVLPPDDSNVLTLPMSAVSHVDFSCAKLGSIWTECYTPQPLSS